MRSAKSIPRFRLVVALAAATALVGAAQAAATEAVGDLVWNDVNNNGMVDPGEQGVPGVVVGLYTDQNGDCVPDDPTALRTQTTNASGHYLFAHIPQGTFIVRIEPQNFAPGAVLEGYVSSTGSIPESGNVADDGKDHGNPGGGGIQACSVVITAGQEPVGESPTTGITWDGRDQDSQTTIDFGVYKPSPPTTLPPLPELPPLPPVVTGQGTDLSITKRATRPTISVGQVITFTIRVRNTGEVTATNVRVCDRVPGRAVFVRARGATFKNGQVCWNVSKLNPGKTAGFQISFRGISVGTIRNTATASASNAGTVTARANVRVTDVRGAVRIPGVTG